MCIESAAATNAATIAAIFEAQAAVSAARSVREEGMDATLVPLTHVQRRLSPAAPRGRGLLQSPLQPPLQPPRPLLHHAAAVQRAPFVRVKRVGHNADVPAGSADGEADAEERGGDVAAGDEADSVWNVVGGWDPRQELALLEEGEVWGEEEAAAAAAAEEEEEEEGKMTMARTTFFCDGAVLRGNGKSWSIANISSIAVNEAIMDKRRNGTARRASFRVMHGQEEG